MILTFTAILLCSTLTEHTKRHAEETKTLHERIETTEAERTCIELELTNVKSERDDLVQKTSIQAFQAEVSSSKQLHVPIASVSDYDLSDVSQKLKAAQKEVSSLSIVHMLCRRGTVAPRQHVTLITCG